jgi:prohibitin 1
MEKFANALFTAGSVIVGGTVFFKTFTYTVDGGQRALIFDRFRGLREKIYGEGMHFFVPFI